MSVISFIFRTLLCFNIVSTEFELFNNTHMLVSSLSELFSTRSESVIEINTMQFIVKYEMLQLHFSHLYFFCKVNEGGDGV